MDYAGRISRKIDNEWYIGVVVAFSLVLQMHLYLVAPLREQTRSKSMLGLISIIFSLSSWIPAFTLILICSRAVFGYDCDTTGHEPPLLVWASIMLLHLGGHGQERETPLSLQQGEIAKELCKVILEFLFYTLLLVISFIFLFKSWSDLTIPAVTLGLTFLLLACTRTFAKLKHLQGKRDKIKLKMSRYDATKQSYLHFHPVEFDLHFMYRMLYGEVVPSKFELILSTIIVLLSAGYPFTLLFVVTISVKIYEFHYGFSCTKTTILKSSLTITSLLAFAYSFLHFLKAIHNHFYDRPDLIWPLTHQLIVYPIMLRHLISHQCRHDCLLPHGWSRTIPRFNLLEYSLQRPSKLSSSVAYMLNSWPLSGKEEYTVEMGEFISYELKQMVFSITGDACGESTCNLYAVRHMISAEGLWVLIQNKHHNLVDCDTPFEERVLQWHIATGILYHTSCTYGDSSTDDNSYMSMLLSDYMGYLLIVQPWIMSKQRGAVFRRCIDMWAKIYKFTMNCGVQKKAENKKMYIKRLCEEIVLRQRQDQNQTVLQGACVLARNLESKFPEANKKWSIIVKVWVEMLTYASIRCSPIDHIHGLSQGGELSTIIRLWMSRLGVLETVCKSVSLSNTFESQVLNFNMGVNRDTLNRTRIEVTKAKIRQEESLDDDNLWPYHTGSIFKVENLLGTDLFGKDESQLHYTGMISDTGNEEKLLQGQAIKDKGLPDRIENDNEFMSAYWMDFGI